jgi:hypothetical protein
MSFEGDPILESNYNVIIIPRCDTWHDANALKDMLVKSHAKRIREDNITSLYFAAEKVNMEVFKAASGSSLDIPSVLTIDARLKNLKFQLENIRSNNTMNSFTVVDGKDPDAKKKISEAYMEILDYDDPFNIKVPDFESLKNSWVNNNYREELETKYILEKGIKEGCLFLIARYKFLSLEEITMFVKKYHAYPDHALDEEDVL